MTTETKSATAAGALAHLVSTSQGQTEKYIKKCPEALRFTQFAPGKATPIWLVGHLANVAEFLGNVMGMNAPVGLPANYRKLFMPVEFGGVAITANPADYPSWDEVVANYAKVMARLAEEARGIPDSELLGATRGKVPDPVKGMIGCLQDSLTVNILHDSHHRGQLAMLVSRPN